MRLTTLGTGTVALAPGRVCAGHLVEAGRVRLLLDCGSGVTHRLAEAGVDWMGITHVALTHFHPDHFGDLPTLFFAWRYGRLPGRSQPVELIGPVGTLDLLARLAHGFGEWLTAPGFPVTVREITAGDTLDLGDGVSLGSRAVPHTPESVAYSVEHGSRRVVYTGDTGGDDGLGEWAKGCDILLCECSLPAAMAMPAHLTPEGCASLAASALPRRLVLTHFYPPVLDVDIAGIVGTQYAGPVTLATDGWHIDLEDG
ncbi:MAG: ribonuclease Z [Gemmatimonadaceae bacterium]|nr:ribonuclease Z [Gemmatimonadaceae bacterium]